MNRKTSGYTNLHKIGAVSTRSGVPAPTLRVWEARHGTFEPTKTMGKHRLYSDEDVLKATLLKRLIGQGHAIGEIGKLGTQALSALLFEAKAVECKPPLPDSESDAVSVVVIGLALASRIEAKRFTLNFQSNLVKVTGVFSDLAHALAAKSDNPPQVLLVKLNSLHVTTQLDLHEAATHCAAQKVIVLYNFAPENVVESLKSAGVLVRREPISDSDLSELIRSAGSRSAGVDTSSLATPERVKPRRYSEETLAIVSTMPSTVACECPRHVAEIISQLASFEQYSKDCLSRSKEDADLHAYLHSVAGSARVLFEGALQIIADYEGIELRREGL